MPHRLIHAALVLALVAGQMVTSWHGIDHLAAAPDSFCTQCLHQPLQKHAIAPDLPPLTVASGFMSPVGAVPPPVADARRFFHPARAPPFISC